MSTRAYLLADPEGQAKELVESVYWIPLYELLESRGIQAVLVNARQLHNVPGRKTDFHDCQWIQLLHSCGLLQGSFRPSDQIVALRALTRQLANLGQDLLLIRYSTLAALGILGE